MNISRCWLLFFFMVYFSCMWPCFINTERNHSLIHSFKHLCDIRILTVCVEQLLDSDEAYFFLHCTYHWIVYFFRSSFSSCNDFFCLFFLCWRFILIEINTGVVILSPFPANRLKRQKTVKWCLNDEWKKKKKNQSEKKPKEINWTSYQHIYKEKRERKFFRKFDEFSKHSGWMAQDEPIYCTAATFNAYRIQWLQICWIR